jgi:hypothetical protein
MGNARFFDELNGMSTPSLRHDEAYRRWQTTYFALAASPSAAMAIELLYRDVDIRQVQSHPRGGTPPDEGPYP